MKRVMARIEVAISLALAAVISLSPASMPVGAFALAPDTVAFALSVLAVARDRLVPTEGRPESAAASLLGGLGIGVRVYLDAMPAPAADRPPPVLGGRGVARADDGMLQLEVAFFEFCGCGVARLTDGALHPDAALGLPRAGVAGDPTLQLDLAPLPTAVFFEAVLLAALDLQTTFLIPAAVDGIDQLLAALDLQIDFLTPAAVDCIDHPEEEGAPPTRPSVACTFVTTVVLRMHSPIVQ